MPWWAWVLVAVVAVAVVPALVFRRQIRFAMRVANALATDKRVPRPLRWAIGVALAMKAIPIPDFGIDEVILLTVGVLLATAYRPDFKAIVAEIRAESRPGDGLTAPDPGARRGSVGHAGARQRLES